MSPQQLPPMYPGYQTYFASKGINPFAKPVTGLSNLD